MNLASWTRDENHHDVEIERSEPVVERPPMDTDALAALEADERAVGKKPEPRS